MAKSDSFISYLQEEIFRELPGITFKSMFGGYGVYRYGRIFGLIANDVLYFKVGDLNRRDYESAGSHPFVYTKNGKSYAMSYWQVPESVLNDLGILEEWVAKSLQIKK